MLISGIVVCFHCKFTRGFIPSFTFSEAKVSEKKKLSEKIKEKENRLKKKEEEKMRELEENVSFF